jgi:hypothetical protein
VELKFSVSFREKLLNLGILFYMWINSILPIIAIYLVARTHVIGNKTQTIILPVDDILPSSIQEALS